MSWQEQIAGARMTVDKEFASRVTESEFSRQQWGLIMTAVEFEVENPGDPEQARMVADTSKLEHVMPELDAIEGRMSQVPGGGGASGGSAGRGFVDSIKSAIRPTHWPGLDVVYSNLRMVDAELNLAYMQGIDRSKRLRSIFDPVRDQYDMIIIDAPPAFGLLAINCVAASDFLLAPIRPAILDMSSSVQYWRILEWLSTVNSGGQADGTGDNVRLFDCKILVTQFNTNSKEAATAVSLMRHLFGTTVMTAVQNQTKELENAGASLQSIYEVRTPAGSRETHRRARANFDMCADEVLSSITSIWESQRLAAAQAMAAEQDHE